MLQESQYLYLTTTGWKSGKAHEIEIWYVEYETGSYLISEHHEKAHWVQNIQHNPTITFRIEESHFAGVAYIIDDSHNPELATAVRKKMDTKYGWSSGLIVELKAD